MGWGAAKEQRRVSGLGHLGWGLLCLFLMGWGFVLGLWVGQGSLANPEQLQELKQWARYVPGLGPQAPAPPPQAAPAKPAEPQPQLSFYDDLEKGETAPVPPAPAAAPARPAPAAQNPPAHAENKPAAPEAKQPPAPPAPAAAAQAKPPAPQLGVPVPVRPAGVPATPPPSATAPRPTAPAAQPKQGRFTVQVASFKEEGQARDLIAQLRGAGHPAYMVPVRLEGVGMRYRVRVGPFYDLDQAQGAAGRIRLQLTLAAYVTRED